MICKVFSENKNTHTALVCPYQLTNAAITNTQQIHWPGEPRVYVLRAAAQVSCKREFCIYKRFLFLLFFWFWAGPVSQNQDVTLTKHQVHIRLWHFVNGSALVAHNRLAINLSCLVVVPLSSRWVI